MTASQRLRTIGFNASLQTRGVLLTLVRDNEISVNGLVDDEEPQGGEFIVSNETRKGKRLAILKEHLAVADEGEELTLDVGDTFVSGAGVYYRITEVEPASGDIKAVFKVEVSERTARAGE